MVSLSAVMRASLASVFLKPIVLTLSALPVQAISKKAGKKAAAAPPAADGNAATGNKAFAKADWKEGFKKKQAGVSDMTLLSTISNESINDNLHKRFQNGDIYASLLGACFSFVSILFADLLPSFQCRPTSAMS